MDLSPKHESRAHDPVKEPDRHENEEGRRKVLMRRETSHGKDNQQQQDRQKRRIANNESPKDMGGQIDSEQQEKRGEFQSIAGFDVEHPRQGGHQESDHERPKETLDLKPGVH